MTRHPMQKHLAASRRDDSVQFNELCNQLAHHSMPTKGDDCGLIVHHDVHDASQPKSDERPQKHAESLKLSPVRRLIFPKDWTSNCVDLWMLHHPSTHLITRTTISGEVPRRRTVPQLLEGLGKFLGVRARLKHRGGGHRQLVNESCE